MLEIPNPDFNTSQVPNTNPNETSQPKTPLNPNPIRILFPYTPKKALIFTPNPLINQKHPPKGHHVKLQAMAMIKRHNSSLCRGRLNNRLTPRDLSVEPRNTPPVGSYWTLPVLQSFSRHFPVGFFFGGFFVLGTHEKHENILGCWVFWG